MYLSVLVLFVIMIRRPPRSTRTDTLFPYATRFRSNLGAEDHKVRLLSEAIGAGVKKLHYGESTPTARCFDIRVNERWLPEDERAEAFGRDRKSTRLNSSH